MVCSTRTAVAILAVLALGASAGAATYSGSLQYTPGPPPDSGDGLYVDGPAGQWTTYTVTFSWTVTDGHMTYLGYEWKYEYRMQVSGTQYAFSHLIIETPTDFTSAQIHGLSGATMDSIALQQTSLGNPGMPENVFGIKFDPFGSLLDWSWSFYSLEPMWGDFYTRCGGKQGGINHAYNYNLTGSVANGFLSPDTDPAVGPSNGSVDYHVLVPTPEPASIALLATGAALLLARRRRR